MRAPAVLGLLVAALVSPAAGGAPSAFPTQGLLVFAGSCGPPCPVGGGVYTMSPDGKKIGFLANGVSAQEPRWSPNRRWVAVSLSFEIVLLRSDDTGIRVITHPPELMLGEGDSSPSWSPDGRHLVFTRVHDVPGTGDVELAVRSVGIDGRRDTKLPAAPRASYPELSPDGKRLVYEAGGGLLIAHADGTGRRHLGPPGLQGTEPRWSPDGRSVAFLDQDAEELRILDTTTNHLHTLPLENVLQFAHAWSPDGNWLAVGRYVDYACDEASGCENLELWLVNAKDGRKRRILNAPAGEIDGLDWR